MMKQQKRPSWHLKRAGAGALFAAALSLLSCQNDADKPWIQPQTPPPVSRNDLTNYGDPNLSRLAHRLRDPSARVHIVQIGDSHTAADFFSGTLRDKFQARYGNAGIGFVPPSIIAEKTVVIPDQPER